MRENLSQATEDYLKTIYTLAGQGGRASTKDIAARLGVTPASVTGMLQKMAASEPALVEYRKHHGAALTPAGEIIALEIIRHHRLLELFLQQTLGYSWEEVHREADRLEHFISEDLEERIAQSLGNPTRDPHGEPIPTRDFQVPPPVGIPLSELRPGQAARVLRIEDLDAATDLLRYLAGIGLVPHARLTGLDYSAFDENVRILVGDRAEQVVLGPNITRKIFVELI